MIGQIRNYLKLFTIGAFVIIIAMVIFISFALCDLQDLAIWIGGPIFVVGAAIQIYAFVVAHKEGQRIINRSLNMSDEEVNESINMMDESNQISVNEFLLKEEWAVYEVSGKKRQFFGDTAFGPMWKDFPAEVDVPPDLEITSFKDVEQYLNT